MSNSFKAAKLHFIRSFLVVLRYSHVAGEKYWNISHRFEVITGTSDEFNIIRFLTTANYNAHPLLFKKKDCLKVFTNTFVNQSFCVGYYEQLKSPYLILFPMMMCLSWLNSDCNFVSMKFVNLPRSTLHCM